MLQRLRFLIVTVALALPVSAHAGIVDPNERDYHAKVFDYAMGAVQPGKSYDWKTFVSSGTIVVGDTFVSKAKSTCRPFTEKFDFSGNKGEISGYGCKRQGDEGWCILHSENMLSCALEPSDSMFQQAIEDATHMIPNAPGMPTISGPSGGANVGQALENVGKSATNAVKGTGTRSGNSIGTTVHNATREAQNAAKRDGNDEPWYSGFWPPWGE